MRIDMSLVAMNIVNDCREYLIANGYTDPQGWLYTDFVKYLIKNNYCEIWKVLVT